MEGQGSEQRAALVTGASYGIGAAIASRLARDGFDAAVTDLRPADLAATAAGCITGQVLLLDGGLTAY